MHILIAPTSFKGSLSASAAGEGIERGLRAAAGEMRIALTTELCPIADGGEGTAEILAETLVGLAAAAAVTGPIDGAPVQATWYLLAPAGDVPQGAPPARSDRWWHTQPGSPTALVAVFDSAQVVGLSLVPAARRDPSRVSTRGIGELIEVARTAGAASVVIGLGGSASVDGGIGAAHALGWRFLGRDGAKIEPLGANLARIERVVPPRGAPALPGIVALVDVTNPLCGPHGAARTFGPQKGATPEQVERLEEGLANLARRAHEAGLAADPDAPGAGAAGGLGFGLDAFFGATIVPGAPAVLDALGIEARLARADLVVTGEGCLDDQTAHGKAVAALADAAARAGVPLAAIAGQTRGDPRRPLRLASLTTLVNETTSASEAQSNAAALLAERAATLLESFVKP